MMDDKISMKGIRRNSDDTFKVVFEAEAPDFTSAVKLAKKIEKELTNQTTLTEDDD